MILIREGWMNKVSERQRQILQLLLENREGLSVDKIANALAISRTAILQHFSKLQQLNYICEGRLNKTGGRPVRNYCLTEQGINSFPKKYSWFSELLLASLKKQMGSERLSHYMYRLGEQVAQEFLPQLQNKTLPERTEFLLSVMEDLGFEAKLHENIHENKLNIQACNCIYHDIAQKHQEICQFDLALISSLLNTDIELEECLAKSGHICQFNVLK
ncbi:MAG: HTH domain-containing protein [Methylococcales bacterium]|nr:HTH domain-containing protein [Methylococcales bacterium]